MCALPIINAETRLKTPRGISICIVGKSGIGKTTLVTTLPTLRTLFVNFERGDLSIMDWKGNSIRIDTWQDWCNLAVLIAGPNPAMRDDQLYSQAHYDAMCERYGASILDQYDTIFVDSITAMGRYSLQWADGESIIGRTSRIDTRASYGLHGRGMIDCLTHLQQYSRKNIVYVGILNEKRTESGTTVYEIQIDGNKVSSELLGIMDILCTMAIVETEPGKFERVLVCHADNPFKFPAKSRSIHVNCIEPAHVGKLIATSTGRIWQNDSFVSAPPTIITPTLSESAHPAFAEAMAGKIEGGQHDFRY